MLTPQSRRRAMASAIATTTTTHTDRHCGDIEAAV